MSKQPAVRDAQDESEELRALDAGEITLEQYLDIKADKAVARLQERLKPEEVEMIRDVIRLELVTHPTTVELVKQATGRNRGRRTG